MNTSRLLRVALFSTAVSTLLAVFLMATPAHSATAVASTTVEGATRRLALVIGSHEGGKGRERLLYAGSDAYSFRHILEELGGLSEGDATLLVDPDSMRVLKALDDMEERTRGLKRAGMRVEAVVYYSGHADENGLRLGNEGMSYRVFRSRLNTLGADVRIAVVDACESGALTRLKGGRSAPAFLIDQSTRSEGYAILTSSSGNEAAQESDRVGGSFFTHALNSGLRGAADASGDGKVTLHEAYQFAYDETLARTQATRGGPQHAGYDIQLSGSGDVVLTDLREASAFLDLSKDLQGRLFIRDSMEHLTAELQKPAGSEIRIGLSSGKYELRLLLGSRWSAASVTLEDGKSVIVTPGIFKAAAGETTAVDSAPEVFPTGKTGTNGGEVFHRVVDTGSSELSTAIFYDAQKEDWNGTQLSLLATDGRKNRRGGQMSLALNLTRGDMEGFQGAIAMSAVGGSLYGLQFAQANVVSDNLRGAQIGPLFSIAGGQTHGFQGSGIFTVTGGNLQGWQAAGIFNVSGGAAKGGQVAGIFDITVDSLKGWQGAGIFTIAGGSVKGGQGAGIFNVTGGELTGAQGAGIANAVGGDVKGGQGAGITNLVWGKVKGGQGAGILNVAGRGVQGGQGAGIANLSGGEVVGGQGAGITNAAVGVQGFQAAGILNIAGTVKGYQIGLVNLSNAYESGAPIGLVNISRQGSFEAETWVEETGMVFVGLRTGAGWSNSHLAMGAKKVNGKNVFAPTLGTGAHFDLSGPFAVETDLLYSMVFSMDGYALNDAGMETDWARLRTGVSWKALPYLSVVGGLSYNVAAHYDSDLPITGSDLPFFHMASSTVSFWPGAFAGIRVGK